MKSAKDEIIFSLKEFIIIIPGAISNFSWGNETIKHCKVEKKRKIKCSLCHYDLYSIYYLNTGFQCRLSSLSSVIRNHKINCGTMTLTLISVLFLVPQLQQLFMNRNLNFITLPHCPSPPSCPQFTGFRIHCP